VKGNIQLKMLQYTAFSRAHRTAVNNSGLLNNNTKFSISHLSVRYDESP